MRGRGLPWPLLQHAPRPRPGRCRLGRTRRHLRGHRGWTAPTAPTASSAAQGSCTPLEPRGPSAVPQPFRGPCHPLSGPAPPQPPRSPSTVPGAVQRPADPLSGLRGPAASQGDTAGPAAVPGTRGAEPGSPQPAGRAAAGPSNPSAEVQELRSVLSRNLIAHSPLGCPSD